MVPFNICGDFYEKFISLGVVHSTETLSRSLTLHNFFVVVFLDKVQTTLNRKCQGGSLKHTSQKLNPVVTIIIVLKVIVMFK